MGNFNNSSDFSSEREEYNKKLRNEFANEIVTKISETGVDFKNFLQAVFAEKILTEKQEEILKLLYGFDDGIVKNANQVAQILWTVQNNIMRIRWEAFEKILQSEVYKDLFPKEDEDEYSFSSEIMKQKYDEIFSVIDSDPDNAYYIVDDFQETLKQEVPSDFDLQDDFEKKELKKNIQEIFEKYGLTYSEAKILQLVYGINARTESTLNEIADMINFPVQKIRKYYNSALEKIKKGEGVSEYLNVSGDKELILKFYQDGVWDFQDALRRRLLEVLKNIELHTNFKDIYNFVNMQIAQAKTLQEWEELFALIQEKKVLILKELTSYYKKYIRDL